MVLARFRALADRPLTPTLSPDGGEGEDFGPQRDVPFGGRAFVRIFRQGVSVAAAR
jgi:hypothetical protein